MIYYNKISQLRFFIFPKMLKNIMTSHDVLLLFHFSTDDFFNIFCQWTTVAGAL